MAILLKPKLVFILGLFVLCSAVLCEGDPTVCSTVYKLGGATALLHSPECSRWTLPDHETSSTFCQTATLQGRQEHQEARVLCAFDLYLPLPGQKRTDEVRVGVTAVFDGHNGSEASHMMSKAFLDYFSVHVQFLAQIKQSTSIVDDSFRYKVLKEGLIGSINDLGAIFAAEAKERNLVSGSTATIALLVDGQIMVANVGDSKAFLCSKKVLSPVEAAKESFFVTHLQKRATQIVAKDLTKDHHPDRDHKGARIEASVGYDQPAISGSIEVISTPEVTDWQHLTAEEGYLVAASDGVFEKMSLEDACELLWEEEASVGRETSMAERLVNTAFEKGSMDNLAAVVVPLQSHHSPSGLEEEEGMHWRIPARTDEL